jgi:sulfatase maturation enzyme AslB (radical SAM superfamily)
MTIPSAPSRSGRYERIEWEIGLPPKVCEVTLNFACNARCLFCYNPTEDPAFAARELSFSAAARALAAGRADGCWVACLIGGEATLRRDLPALARLARKLGYACVKVVSNGLRLADPDYARELSAAGVNCFNVSIHGASAAQHDRLVGVPGAFDKCLRALENARRLGKEAGVDHVFTRLNFRDFPRYFEMMLVEREINYFNMIFPHYRGVMAAHVDELALSYREAAPFALAAMDLFSRRGLPALSRVLVNFPPCTVPGYEHLVADWEERTDGGEPMFAPGAAVQRLDAMKLAQRQKPAACGSCVYASRCQGVDREYLARHGEDEFVPLKTKPRPAPIKMARAEARLS